MGIFAGMKIACRVPLSAVLNVTDRLRCWPVLPVVPLVLTSGSKAFSLYREIHAGAVNIIVQPIVGHFTGSRKENHAAKHRRKEKK